METTLTQSSLATPAPSANKGGKSKKNKKNSGSSLNNPKTTQKLDVVLLSKTGIETKSERLICDTDAKEQAFPPSLQYHSSVGYVLAFTQLLNEGSHEYHTFKLPEDKTLRTVLHDISQVLPTDEVKQNLIDVEFEVIKVDRKQEDGWNQNRFAVDLCASRKHREELELLQFNEVCQLRLNLGRPRLTFFSVVDVKISGLAKITATTLQEA